MKHTSLENLVRIGRLKAEPPSRIEIVGLLRSGRRRLEDAENDALNIESRFDLAYNAAHALALAALRSCGFRSESRYQVFQCLTHTLELPAEQWRVLDQAHRKRNLAEYEGDTEVDAALVEAVIRVSREMAHRICDRGMGDLSLNVGNESKTNQVRNLRRARRRSPAVISKLWQGPDPARHRERARPGLPRLRRKLHDGGHAARVAADQASPGEHGVVSKGGCRELRVVPLRLSRGCDLRIVRGAISEIQSDQNDWLIPETAKRGRLSLSANRCFGSLFDD